MRRARIVGVVGLLVFSTGAAALVYQVVLERYLSRIVGSDHVATGLTLATFLGGLATGYLACGRLTLAVRRHLRVYAVLEATIGLWALLFPSFFGWIESAVAGWGFRPPWGILLQGLPLAVVLVGPPTVLMGATVPFLTRALAAERERLSSLHAAVYATNTAGAVVGVLTAGFLLVPSLGLPTTMRAAALVNLIAALAFAALDLDPVRVAEAFRGEGTIRQPLVERRRFPTTVLLVVAGLNGAAVLMLEGASIRLGKLIFGSSTYTFSMVVAVFVLALAAGGAVVARLRALPAGLLAVLQATSGLLLLLVYLQLDRAPYLGHLLRIAFASNDAGFWLYHVALLVLLASVLLAPVALLGTTVPMLYHELGADLEEAGWASGRLLAWNGLGTVAGSLAGSFVLFLWLDSARVFLVAPLLAGFSALLVSRPLGRIARGLVVLVLLLAGSALAFRPFHEHERLAIGLFRTREPLPYSFAGAAGFHEAQRTVDRTRLFEEGPVASVAIVEDRPMRSDRTPGLALYVNGKSESSTAADATTLRLLADLPALWAERRERVLVIGLGTGVTAGEFSLYPDVTTIRVAEISPTVAALLSRFAAANHAVHADPRLDLRVEDAWITLRRDDEPWDVISTEASNPWVTGVDSLFTREFYARVHERLAPDGLFVQWMQLYECDFEMLALVINSLTAEFPTVHAFRGTEGDLLFLAAKRPFDHAARLRADAALAGNGDVAASLREVGIESLDDLLRREVTSLAVLRRQAERYGVNTLDRPRLHFFAGRRMYTGSRVTDAMLRGVVDVDAVFDQSVAPR